MKVLKLIVNTKSERYPILIGSYLLPNMSKIFKKYHITFQKCLLIIDKNIPTKKINIIKKSLKNKNIFLHKFSATETNKNQKSIDKILEILLKKNFSRQDCIISIGGGITGDISGYAASLFKRGIQFVNVPSTLLAQVDSSIGGKTGINTSYGKNLIGSFYQPKLVISDIDFLKTLPEREIICGYGEILKHSIISKKVFFKFLNENFNKIINLKSPYIEKTIYESCKIKKIVVEKDEKEKDLRKFLNFGHTFGHAFEASLKFSKKLNHGEAVLLGMKTALDFSLKKKILNKQDYEIIDKHIKISKLPNNIKKYFTKKDIDRILSFMTKDKKNESDRINLILLKKIGTPIIIKNLNKKHLKPFLKNQLIN
tara:strand:+ start:1620 stop:2726 length:1107 start_codon:yes stop_codon:yes gene_type:complete